MEGLGNLPGPFSFAFVSNGFESIDSFRVFCVFLVFCGHPTIEVTTRGITLQTSNQENTEGTE